MKITLPEIIMLVLIALGTDIADAVLNMLALIPVIGISFGVIAWAMDAIAGAIIAIWFFAKGQSGMRGATVAIVGSVIDSVPFLNFLPIRTVTVVTAIIMVNNADNLPQHAKTAVRVVEKVAKV